MPGSWRGLPLSQRRQRPAGAVAGADPVAPAVRRFRLLSGGLCWVDGFRFGDQQFLDGVVPARPVAVLAR